MTESSLAAIIVGGGRSRRMQGHDKLYAPLGGRPVIAVTVEAFAAAASVDTIILVVAEERVGQCQKLAHERGWRKVSAICPGGASRSHSVASGLHALQDTPTAYVAVHDAARPFISPELIYRTLAAARQHGAAIPGIPCTNTIRRVDPNDRACETLPRDALRAVQTPQVFSREICSSARMPHRRGTWPDSPMMRRWWSQLARGSMWCRGTMVT